MDKSFYYSVDRSLVGQYRSMLELMKIPYVVETPVALLKDGANQVVIVFPNMPVKLYGMVRKLFKKDGLPYHK
ncbi:hypothetical protein EDM56_01995 [Brevibacillus fluminis]|uniref:DUF2007 domain-containing protein n=1 Tax=Brevibacillus fluminis TaxID=511487 RepID=A0A3M8DY85_9BACL|nr:hypothetical protein EDM56_01995 [Brevibacillus fluminis]